MEVPTHLCHIKALSFQFNQTMMGPLSCSDWLREWEDYRTIVTYWKRWFSDMCNIRTHQWSAWYAWIEAVKLIPRRKKVFTRMVNQAKLRLFNTTPKFKNGYEVPRTYEQSVRLDENKNNHIKRQDAATLEREQINEYHVFLDKRVTIQRTLHLQVLRKSEFTYFWCQAW